MTHNEARRFFLQIKCKSNVTMLSHLYSNCLAALLLPQPQTKYIKRPMQQLLLNSIEFIALLSCTLNSPVVLKRRNKQQLKTKIDHFTCKWRAILDYPACSRWNPRWEMPATTIAIVVVTHTHTHRTKRYPDGIRASWNITDASARPRSWEVSHIVTGETIAEQTHSVTMPLPNHTQICRR